LRQSSPWQRARRQFFKNECRSGLHRDGIPADVHGRAAGEKREPSGAMPANAKKMIQVTGLGLNLAKIR
jgi:hypothetical protein